ncbi:MAG: hypothetical protein WC932_01970 [archaeon]|jgi:hypothetical protein
MSLDIKNQFSRTFNRPEPNVGALGKKQRGEYYSGIKIWGRQVKGENRD